MARNLIARHDITTAVDRVALHWGRPQQRWVDRLTRAGRAGTWIVA